MGVVILRSVLSALSALRDLPSCCINRIAASTDVNSRTDLATYLWKAKILSICYYMLVMLELSVVIDNSKSVYCFRGP